MAAYTPKHLRRWTMPDHYFGASWPDYYSAGFGQSRDSAALERSNFAVALRCLGGGTETVHVVREGHWAVGWVEWIAIHEDDVKALAVADGLAAEVEDYPVLDEYHFSRVEDQDAQEMWTNCFDDARRLRYIREHRHQFEFCDFADLMGCVRGKYFSGYACVLLY